MDSLGTQATIIDEDEDIRACLTDGAPQSKFKYVKDTSLQKWKQQTLPSSWTTPNQAFTPFSRLPPELQTLVWKCALPDPRTFRGGILYYVEFNFSNPRAIIPKIKDIIPAYTRGFFDIPRECPRRCFDWALDSLGSTSSCSPKMTLDVNLMATLQRPVISMLHTCRESRTIARSIYSLDLRSDIVEENQLDFCPRSDLIYFPTPQKRSEVLKPLHLAWMASNFNIYSRFMAIQNVSVDLDIWLLKILDLDSGEDLDLDDLWDWLARFSRLKRLVLLRSLVKSTDRAERVVFSAASDTLVGRLARYPVNAIEQLVRARSNLGWFGWSLARKDISVLQTMVVMRESQLLAATLGDEVNGSDNEDDEAH